MLLRRINPIHLSILLIIHSINASLSLGIGIYGLHEIEQIFFLLHLLIILVFIINVQLYINRLKIVNVNLVTLTIE